VLHIRRLETMSKMVQIRNVSDSVHCTVKARRPQASRARNMVTPLEN
jgi:hypothetical protein